MPAVKTAAGFVAVDVHEALDGTSHCVSQTTSASGSGETGAARLMFETFIATRRHGPTIARAVAARAKVAAAKRRP